MNKDFITAVEEIEREKGISKEILFEAIESALVSAYKKNYGTSENVLVNIDRLTGDIGVFMVRQVAEEVTDEINEISLEEARKIDNKFEIGDSVRIPVTPANFGRIAAQTAKQVVKQRIREAERGMVYEDYLNRKGEIISGTISGMGREVIIVNIGKAEGLVLPQDRVEEEFEAGMYELGNMMKFYVTDVRKGAKGPQIYLSRSTPELVKRLFELEVPEISEGLVEIRSVAREAGSRSKIAVYTSENEIDAIGACVGPRGVRVQNICDEINGEKIDIISWSDNPKELIEGALSPSKVEKVIVNMIEKTSIAIVPDYQLSLAIGREGQNVRLAAKLCNWKIDIKSHSQFFPDGDGTMADYDGFEEQDIFEQYDDFEDDDFDEDYGEEGELNGKDYEDIADEEWIGELEEQKFEE